MRDMPIRVAIDASRSVERAGKTGVEMVSDVLLRAMDACVPAGVEPMYYTPAPIPFLPAERQRVVLGKRLWSVWHLSRALWREKPDRFFAPVHALPWGVYAPTTHVLHDVAFLREPRAYSWTQNLYLRLDAWHTKWRRAQVVTPTHFVAQEVQTRLGVPSTRIAVIPWAALPIASKVEITERKPVILFIGRLEWKKNVDGLLEGFALFREKYPDWELVLLGKPGFGYERFAHLLKGEGVRVLGYVNDEEKARWLACASVYVAVSREEGSSLPMLEAMQAGVPVLRGPHPVLEEVAGDAAYAIPSIDARSIAEGLTFFADHPEARQAYRERGFARAQERTWEQVAQEMWRVVLGDYVSVKTKMVLSPTVNHVSATSRALSSALDADHQ